ncbi:MAG TPA: glycosyltransferase family 9 protein [Candidatus Krumholzibacteria bacterium]|nr:glycosyltransferase family 9 protein [Candidatus Krumholzibacteria bacterium]
MGRVKTLERSGKRALMAGVGRALRARPITAEQFRAMRFERILVIRQHNQMGDMMLAIPAFRAIRETFPSARIGVVSSTLNRGVLANSPYVDDIYTYDKKSPARSPGLVRKLRARRFDLAIVLHTVSFSFTSVVLAVLSGARVRIGSTSARVGESLTGSYLNLTLPLPSDTELATMNEAEHNLHPLRAVGITTADIAPLLVPGPGSERWAEDAAAACWKDGTVRLAVHPGAGKAENIWPPERWARVVDDLASERDVTLAVIEGPADAASVGAFQSACSVKGTVFRGRPILDVAALLRRADLVLCNDTGVMHVAAAAQARVLAVFGPTDPFRWAPRCEGLHIVRSPGGRLLSLGADEVVAEAARLLDARATG